MTSGKTNARTRRENDFLIECTCEPVDLIGVLEVDDRVRISHEVALDFINSRKTLVTAQDQQRALCGKVIGVDGTVVLGHNHVPHSLEVMQIAARLPLAPSVEDPYQKPSGCAGTDTEAPPRARTCTNVNHKAHRLPDGCVGSLRLNTAHGNL